MAVTFNMDDKLFEKVEALTLIQGLKNAGYKVLVNFHTVVLSAPNGKPVASVVLPVSSTAIMKGLAPHHLLKQVNKDLHGTLGPYLTTPTGALEYILVDTESTLGAFGQTHKTTSPVSTVAKAKPSKSVDLNTVVPLAQATCINQRVSGTSAGSVYIVVGLGERLKMAIRRVGTKLSIRVEGAINSTERGALKSLGFSDNGGYLSTHFSLQPDCPPERVLGVLFFHPQLKFIEHVGSISEVANG